ncbi:MAG: DUF3341 domain-containing protein [Candidatus Promineifilaceae bacterium]|nr:DUF3341 domain-containing protein [Candidatus Promineifilaceae bacterium]
MTANEQRLYGLMAEFEEAEHLIEAARTAHEAGYREMDAYSPFPVEGLAEAVGYRPHYRMNWIVVAGLAVGAAAAFGMQYYASVVDYPLNVGGRPLNSWPAFIPVTFELAVLVAAFAAIFGMFALNGLPQPYHPAFNVEGFARASQDRFFLLIHADDPQFDPADTRRFLQELAPQEVNEVEP